MERAMKGPRLFAVLGLASFVLNLATPAGAVAKTIGILVYDGFLTSDVTAPVEVFGAATKQAPFSSYKVVLVSATKNKEVLSEEGLRVVADTTIYSRMRRRGLAAKRLCQM